MATMHGLKRDTDKGFPQALGTVREDLSASPSASTHASVTLFSDSTRVLPSSVSVLCQWRSDNPSARSGSANAF